MTTEEYQDCITALAIELFSRNWRILRAGEESWTYNPGDIDEILNTPALTAAIELLRRDGLVVDYEIINSARETRLTVSRPQPDAPESPRNASGHPDA